MPDAHHSKVISRHKILVQRAGSYSNGIKIQVISIFFGYTF